MNMTSYQYECFYANRMLVHNLHFELMHIAYSNEYIILLLADSYSHVIVHDYYIQ